MAYVAVASATTGNSQTLSRVDLTSLAAGEIVVSVTPDQQPSVARISAAIEIAARPGRVWAAMLDCTRALKFVGGLIACRVLERDPNGTWDVREHIVSWMALLPQVRSVFRSEYVTDQSISFRRVTGDIDVLEGQWSLEPLRGGTATRLRYVARVGKETLIPSAIIRSAIESDVPKTLRRLRDEVMRGAG